MDQPKVICDLGGPMARKRGRLSILEQQKLETRLRECFLNEVEPKVIVGLKIANIKTVNEYYDKLRNEILENTKKSFLERSKNKQELTIMRLKLQILKFTAFSNQLEEKLSTQNNNVGTKSYRENMKLFVILHNKITELTMKLLDVENSPVADVSLEMNTTELIKKYGNTIT